MTQYHDFQNTTFDINYRELAEEYFQGGLSQLVNGVGNGNGPRGRSRAAGGPVAQRTAKEDKEFIQRFLQLKYSILFLQRNKKFGRYCFYGKTYSDCFQILTAGLIPSRIVIDLGLELPYQFQMY